MPDKVVHRSKMAVMLAVVAVLVAFSTSLAAYTANSRAIDRNKDAIAQVQQSRRDITLQSCQEVNQRNINTKAYLLKLTKEAIKEKPAREAAIRTSLAQTNVLIDALSPKQDCKALVHRRYG